MKINQEKKETNKTYKKILKKNPNKKIGGPKGLEPNRYGDWEVKGRVSDF